MPKLLFVFGLTVRPSSQASGAVRMVDGDANGFVVAVDLFLDGGKPFRVRFGFREVHRVLHVSILPF
jgi:hypothetical protein